MIFLTDKTEESILAHLAIYAKGLYCRVDVLTDLKIIVAFFLKRDPSGIELGMVLEYLLKTAQRVNPDVCRYLILELISPQRIRFHPGFFAFSSEYKDELGDGKEGFAMASLNAKIIIKFLLGEISKFKGRLPAPNSDLLPLKN